MKAVASQVDAGLPLRGSCRVGDKHYASNIVGLSEKIDIFLDGVKLDWATSWDVPAGRITRHVRDAKGDLVLEKSAPTFETLEGRVEVRWIKAPEASA